MIATLIEVRGKALTALAAEQGVERERWESDRSLRRRLNRRLGTIDLLGFTPDSRVMLISFGIGLIPGVVLTLIKDHWAMSLMFSVGSVLCFAVAWVRRQR